MKKSFFLIILLSIICIQAYSQDVILKKNDELIKCKIKEVGLDEIKYTLPEYSDDVMFSIDKDDISKVIFENGKEMTFSQAMTDPEKYKDNKKNAIKIEFLSPLSGNTTFAWEHSLKPGRSYEITFGIAGLGLDIGDRNRGGAFAKFGYKFIKSPDFYLRGLRYAHLLKGSYVKPEISMGLVAQDYERYSYNSYYPEYIHGRSNVFGAALTVVLGKQWIFDNAFLIDLHAGIGYGISSADENYWDTGYRSGFIVGNDGFPIASSAGFKLGFLIK
ncbi:MAG TPA: hypothetical protein VK172_02445 [Lentimicrobium sp.]|nr:hypothetical protein [Lentimicrobium sp.]